jgi:hypothetical protein
VTAFDPDRLASLLRPAQIRSLKPLIQEAGDYEFTDDDFLQGRGPKRPFLRAGRWLVVHRPFDIVDSLRHHLSMIVAERCGPEVAEAFFAQAVESDVSAAFQRMGLEWLHASGRSAEAPFALSRYRCDADKEIVVASLTDDFRGLEEGDSYTLWEGHELILE